MAWDFNGTSSFLGLASPGVNINGSFTVSIWFKIDNFASAGSFSVLWSIEQGFIDGILLRVNSSSKLVLTQIGGGLIHDDVGTTTLSKDTWYHVCYSQFDQSTGTVYLDGAAEISMVEQEPRVSPGNVLYFGIYAGLIYLLDGQIDSVRIHLDELSQQNVQQERWTRTPQFGIPHHWWDPLPGDGADKVLNRGTSGQNLLDSDAQVPVGGAPISYSVDECPILPPLRLVITFTAVDSDEAHGTIRLELTIGLAAVPSDEAYGTLTLSPNVTLTGVPTDEAEGSLKLEENLSLTGVPTDEAEGTPTLNPNVTLTGVPTDEAEGTLTLNPLVALTGVPTDEVEGTLKLEENVSLTGVPTDEAHGTPTLTVAINLSGIPTDEAHGTLTLDENVRLLGVPSDEAHGSTVVGIRIDLTGVDSDFAAGTLTLNPSLVLTGVPSDEAYGTLALTIAVSGGSVYLLIACDSGPLPLAAFSGPPLLLATVHQDHLAALAGALPVIATVPAERLQARVQGGVLEVTLPRDLLPALLRGGILPATDPRVEETS